MEAIGWAMLVIVLFMGIHSPCLRLGVANLALTMNLVLIVGIMSMIRGHHDPAGHRRYRVDAGDGGGCERADSTSVFVKRSAMVAGCSKPFTWALIAPSPPSPTPTSPRSSPA